MASPTMLALFLLVGLGLAPGVSAQEPAPATQAPATSPLDAPVLVFPARGGSEERRFTARDVVDAVAPEDEQLRRLIEEDAGYRKAYLASPRFLQAVRAFADRVRLDELGLRAATREELLAEARAYARDHGLRLTPEGVLRALPLRIEVRARLLTQQDAEFGTPQLRQHMLRSVPEFFGQLQIAWIRVPLFDTEEVRALTEDEVRAVYQRLDEAARRLTAEELTWKEAVAEYSRDPGARDDGAVGIVERTMTDRFEEGLLRPLFSDLGFKQIEGELLRGPILAERWAYLVRIEAMRIDGVPALERARPRIIRSLRETLLQEALDGIRQVMPAEVLAPVLAD